MCVHLYVNTRKIFDHLSVSYINMLLYFTVVKIYYWLYGIVDHCGYVSLCQSLTSMTEKIEFCEITQTCGLLRRSRSFKVTEFGTKSKAHAISY